MEDLIAETIDDDLTWMGRLQLHALLRRVIFDRGIRIEMNLVKRTIRRIFQGEAVLNQLHLWGIAVG